MKNILVVEDDPFTIDFYRFIFKRAGYNPVVMEDGDKVLEILGSTDVSLIIMDINLKNTYLKGDKIDGVKLSSIIKQNEKFSRIPIMLVTAYSPTIKGNELYRDSGADDYITKPIVDFNLLIDKINKLVVNG